MKTQAKLKSLYILFGFCQKAWWPFKSATFGKKANTTYHPETSIITVQHAHCSIILSVTLDLLDTLQWSDLYIKNESFFSRTVSCFFPRLPGIYPRIKHV